MPIHYYDTGDKVIYIKSLSKAFMPGLRLGVAIFPDVLIDEYLTYKRFDDLNSSILTQAGFELYLKSGMYEKHLLRINKLYKKKLTRIKGYIEAIQNPKINVTIPDTAFFIWVILDKSVNANKLVKKLEKNNVLVSPAKEFFLHERSTVNGFRLCVANVSDQDIIEGLKKVNSLTL